MIIDLACYNPSMSNQGRIERIGNEIRAQIPFQFLEDGGKLVMYAQALELCGYGNTIEEVKKDFHNALTIFFKETIAHGTFENALEELGWKKVIHVWEPRTRLLNASIEDYNLKVAA